MKGKHTPGPWTESWIRPDPKRNHTFDPTCSILAQHPTHGTVRIADVADPVGPEEEANARLIAAAPEMLATLKVALAHVTAEETTTASAATRDAMRGVAKILRAAIAIVEE